MSCVKKLGASADVRCNNSFGSVVMSKIQTVHESEDDYIVYLHALPYRYVLGMRVDATSYDDATDVILTWAKSGQSKYVCAANVHMVMEAYDDEKFRRVVNSADLVTSDGMPLVWALRAFGISEATRVYGPDLMTSVCGAVAKQSLPIALYGGSPDHLDALRTNLLKRFPGLNIVHAYAPPYRKLSVEEDDAVIRAINSSGAIITFVALGCPKQERWMLDHKGRVRSVMVGVGAAFDFYSGRVEQAPALWQRFGFEWLFRLTREPKRLLWRYVKHNPRFLVLLALQWLGVRRWSGGRAAAIENRS